MVRELGEFRSTLGSLRPLSGLCSLGKYQNFSSSLFHRQLVIFFVNTFSSFFLTFFNLLPKLTAICKIRGKTRNSKNHTLAFVS